MNIAEWTKKYPVGALVLWPDGTPGIVTGSARVIRATGKVICRVDKTAVNIRTLRPNEKS